MSDEQLDLFGGPRPPQEPRRSAPYQGHSSTSRRAAEAAERTMGACQRRVLIELAKADQSGLTDIELQERTGLGESTERPRRVELVRAGLVADSGETRIPKGRSRPCTVWVIADWDEAHRFIRGSFRAEKERRS